MPEADRPRHRLVWRLLEALNAKLLAETRCFFGGGTRIVLELDEYRESVDVDLLCSDRSGYRTLRSMITQRSFGELFRREIELVREIRADMYGIRTFVLVENQPLKFEIISEGRIDLGGEFVERFPVPLLDRTSCFAEKFLANADRGRDESTRARDVVDLAFMSARWSRTELLEGRDRAVGAYGDSVHRELAATLARLEDRAYRRRCITELMVSSSRTLTRGLQILRRLG